MSDGKENAIAIATALKNLKMATTSFTETIAVIREQLLVLEKHTKSIQEELFHLGVLTGDEGAKIV